MLRGLVGELRGKQGLKARGAKQGAQQQRSGDWLTAKR
jgi:hypothetical protein